MPGVLAVADDQASFVLPLDAMLVSADMFVGTDGTVGLATTLSIETDSSTTDLTGGALSVAHDAADDWDSTDMTATTFVKVEQVAGEVFHVCVDAVPTGADSADLTVHLGFVTI